MHDKENKELTRSRKIPSSSTQLVCRHKLPTCKSTSSSTILRMTENRDKSASNNRVASAMTIATDMMPKVTANTLTKCCLKMQRHTYSIPTTTTTHPQIRFFQNLWVGIKKQNQGTKASNDRQKVPATHLQCIPETQSTARFGSLSQWISILIVMKKIDTGWSLVVWETYQLYLE